MTISRNQVKNFLERIPRVQALVVGDLMLDEYLWGSADRISPEAPVPVVDIRRQDLRLGGAGNVLNNLATLGCRVQVVSVLGEDVDGLTLRKKLDERGLSIEGVHSQPGRITSRKTRVLASNQQMVRIDRESKEPISEAMERRILEYVGAYIGEVDVVFLSDYQKGVLTEKVLQGVISRARTAGIPVVVDPKGSDYRKYRGATLLTPNRKEAQLATGIAIDDEASLCRAGRALQQDLDLQALVLTRSEEGMSLFLHDGQHVHLPTQAREVYDVSGAGDTVLSVIGLGLACGFSLEESAALSNIASGVVVGKVGTSTVSPREILEAVGRPGPGEDSKVKDRHSLAGILEAERQEGKTIVFTNGCFDLLHVGHVKYLQKARQQGDLLVLGLNTDASIQRLKGPLRPLVGENERACVMAALQCVDYVVLFDEDTPLELITLLRPQILVKGADYAPENVVGREVVESYGGRLELIEFVEGKSTTNIVEKILLSHTQAPSSEQP